MDLWWISPICRNVQPECTFRKHSPAVMTTSSCWTMTKHLEPSFGRTSPRDIGRYRCLGGICARFQRHLHRRGLARRTPGRVDLGVLHDYGGFGDRQASRHALHQVAAVPEHWPVINALYGLLAGGGSNPAFWTIDPPWSPGLYRWAAPGGSWLTPRLRQAQPPILSNQLRSLDAYRYHQIRRHCPDRRFGLWR